MSFAPTIKIGALRYSKKKIWKDWYIDIDFAVEKLCKRDKAWQKVMPKITIEHMLELYVLIERKTFFK